MINPGFKLNYTWDNSLIADPECEWSVYGGCEDAIPLHWSQGKLLWGEKKIVYKTVKKAFNSSSTSETDSESEDEDSEDSHRRQSLSSKRKESVISPNVPKNIVYKHKKTVYWISDCTSDRKNIISFFTTRKSAANFLSKQKPRNAKSLILTAPSLHASLFDGEGRESLSVNCLQQSTQWFLFVNDVWRYLGKELSSVLEIAFTKGLKNYSYKGYFKVDFKQMTSSSPIFASLKRVVIPACSVMLEKTSDKRGSFSLSSIEIQLRSGGKIVGACKNLHLDLQNISTMKKLRKVDLSLESLYYEKSGKQEHLNMSKAAKILDFGGKLLDLESVNLYEFTLILHEVETYSRYKDVVVINEI